MKTEELVAALRQCGSVGAGCDGCPFESGGAINAVWCGDALVLAAADRLEGYVDRCKRYADEIMELRERERWIPVEERLPERDGPVLASYGFSEGGEISDMRFFRVMDYYAVDPKPHFQNEGYCGLTVTHWMPLPPVPEENDCGLQI